MKQAVNNIIRNYSAWIFVVLTFLVPFAAYTSMEWYQDRMGKLPILGNKPSGNDLSPDHRIADFNLINQDNTGYRLNDWDDKIVVSAFFFTHCPTICPKMINSLKKVQEEFGDDPSILICSFSIDPVRDSAARLKAYALERNIKTGQWQLLTGDKKDIYKMARNSFMITATDGDGGPDDFIHSDKLVLTDRYQRIRGYYSGIEEKEIRRLINDIKKLKNESPEN